MVALEEVEVKTGEEDEEVSYGRTEYEGVEGMVCEWKWRQGHASLTSRSPPPLSLPLSLPLPTQTLFEIRAKLFVFGETLLDKGTGTKSWRERGVGTVKLLKHREFGKIRTLMRQDKTMKIIVNHVVDPRIKLEPNAGSDRSWVWSAFDFADGELVETVFALRFGDSDKANSFKTAFGDAQKEMEAELAGEDAGDQGAGDEAAEALEGLKTGEKEEEGEKE